MLDTECDWPEWVEELFDNDEALIVARPTKSFKWEFLDEQNNGDDVEYA